MKLTLTAQRMNIRHCCAGVVLLLCTICVLWLYALQDHAAGRDSWTTTANDTLAARLHPNVILSRPIAMDQTMHMIPKYLHQSWMADELPQRMSRWSHTCRARNQDWRWILWADEDNLKMVEMYFPWLLETYQALPAEINRADVSRNMYMYLFGGVYADLDTECLQPFERLFDQHHISMMRFKPSSQPGQESLDAAGSQVALFGRMDFDGTDNTLYHTIPNAWMAATPGHPIFLLVLERLKQTVIAGSRANNDFTAEGLTGPIALYHAVEEYSQLLDNGSTFAEYFAGNPSYQLFNRTTTGFRIELLPPENIYPYSWNNQGIPSRSVCWAGSRKYSSQRCKAKVTTDQSYTITYWSHTWG